MDATVKPRQLSTAGRRLNLMKAGPQGGIDMGTDPGDAGPSLAIKAKRYGGKTSLAVDQLKRKLADAALQRPELDLLAFGATREISRDDQDALGQAGERMSLLRAVGGGRHQAVGDEDEEVGPARQALTARLGPGFDRRFQCEGGIEPPVEVGPIHQRRRYPRLDAAAIAVIVVGCMPGAG